MGQKVHPYLARQHMLSNDYEIYHFRDQKPRNIAPHQHDFYEIWLYISGEVKYMIEGRCYEIRTGDIMLLNTREIHHALTSNNEVYERIVLWVDPNFLKSLSLEKADLTHCFEDVEIDNLVSMDFEMRQDIRSIMEKLLEMEDYSGFGKELLYRAYITELMVKLNNLTKEKKRAYSSNAKKNALIAGMIDYIESHLGDDISIDVLAERFYLSKYHLSREFKKYTGVSIHRYIVLKRLIRSKDMMAQQYSVTDAFTLSGFGDYSNFFRAFKTEYGMTPKQYQELMTIEDGSRQ